MKKYLLAVLLLASFQSFGQFINYTNINGRYKWIAGKFDSTFTIPSGTTPSLRVGGGTGPGALFYRTTDSTVYQYTGTQWIKLRAGVSPTDTAGIWISNVYRQTGTDSVFYVKGGTSTFAFRDSIGNVGGGGGGGKIYYFNGGVNLGTFAGLTMYELGDTAVTSTAANFTRSTTGNLANFITDVNRPGLLQIPAGVWTVDAYLSETGGGANHAEIWIEVEKWNGSTITTIATSPIEQITNGNVIDLYTWSVSIPTTTLAVTDRIIIQFYITNTNGKTVTLYTQNGYVGEVHTTFTTGIGSLNGLTAPTQYFATGTSGTDFAISSSTATHTFNLPTASGSNRGALSSTDWTTFNSKVGGSGTTNYVSKFTGSGTIGNSQIFDNGTNVGIGLTSPANALHIDKGTGVASYSQFTAGVLTGQLATDGFEVGIDASGNAIINQQENLSMLFFTNNTERIRILQGGNVGIGTISPSAILDVNASNGEIRSTGTSTTYTQYNAFITSGVNMRIGAFATNNGYLGTTTNHPFTIETNNTQRARFFANGNLLIGSGTTDPGYLLDVSGTARVREYLYMLRSDGNETAAALTFQSGGTIDIGKTFRVIGTNQWNNTTSSTSYIQNGYTTKNFVSTPTQNSSYSSFDFSNSGPFSPTIANPYTQKLINGAMTINSTAATNSFHGISISATDNSASIANNVFAVYADATLGTNGSATRWAGYFVGRGYFSSNLLLGTTTDGGQRLQVNGTSRLTGDVTIVTTTNARQITFENSTVRTGVNISQPNNTLTFNNGNGFELNSNNVTYFTSAATYFTGFQNAGQFIYRNASSVNAWATVPDATVPYAWGRKLALTGGTTITVPDASAVLDIQSTTMGFLPPRMTGAQAEAIASPATGLMVYANNGNGTTITSTGWWGYNGTTWVKLN